MGIKGMEPGIDEAMELELKALLDALAPEQRAAVLDYARRLARPVPCAAPRGPQGETVVAALRRLSRSYPRPQRRRALAVGADLLAAHMLAGRPAEAVISELESLFHTLYLRDFTDAG